jgi:cellulose synthase (UDP-forming)
MSREVPMEISGFSSVRRGRDRAGADPARRLAALRAIAVANAAAGLVYLAWRYAASINVEALALSLFLIAAESYSYLDSLLFAATMWKPLRRSSPPPLEEATVDVFITTYNEPIEIVRSTAEAALAIAWSPLSVHILDDGSRDGMRALAAELGCGYITRGEEWKGKDKHAKAGNVNNALGLTSGEFILILDADQIPDPRIVSRTIGYFADPRLAFVQTPQSFYNLPPGDPFGSDAPFFYGPIMRGKDGWNAAFFCGSNALLRREALMQVGLLSYAEATQRAFLAAMKELRRRYRASILDPAPLRARKRAVRRAAAAAATRLGSGDSLQEASAGLRAAFGVACPDSCAEDAAEADFVISRKEEAIAVEGVSTVSVTEDMATALRLHASGWKSAFHSEILAYGLAPDDLGSALAQRLRWAQGTIQVLFRDSPLTKKGLTLGQRLMYFGTIFSYFSGFSNLVFVLCPLVFLFFGISPVRAWNLDFFLFFVPFYVLNRVMFYVAAEGLSIRRGEQYNLGLFPLWIKAALGVLSGRKIAFAVTPKTRQSGNFLPAIKTQIGVIILTAAGMAFAAFGLISGSRADLFGILVNSFWGCVNCSQLIVIVRAAIYSPPKDRDSRPPEFAGRERSAER